MGFIHPNRPFAKMPLMKAALPAHTIPTKSAAKPAARTVAALEGARSVERTFKAIHASTRFTTSAALDAFKHVVVKK